MSNPIIKSYAGDFSSSLLEHQLHQEIDDDTGISPNCLSVNRVDDTITITFDSDLSVPSETDALDTLISNHTPVYYDNVHLQKVSGTEVPMFETTAGTKVRIGTQNPVEVHIAQDAGVGQYTSLAAAVAENSLPGTIYIVHPGIYVEANPITLPQAATLRAKGTAGNTILMPADLTKDFLILAPWCKISKFVISGTATPAQKCLGRGIYFDGGVGFGGYALMTECIVQNFDTCIETKGAPTGAHTLLLHRVQCAATTAPLTNGLYAHTHGQIISNSFVAAGVPVPISPVPLPITNAISSKDIGTKVSINITSIYYCGAAVHIDNGGEVEITLLTATSCDRAICVGANGTTSKIRAVNFNMKSTVTYDLEVLSTDAQIDLVGAQMDESLINNPNGVKINATFHGNKGGKHYQAITGDVRIGTVDEPTRLAIGEGKYNVDTFVVYQNDNLEVGTWTNISDHSKSESGSTTALFAGTAAGNCCYIGAEQIPKGVKIHVANAVTAGDVTFNDVMAEYWDGSAWQPLSIMINNAASPFYFESDPFINTVGKYQIRFGLHNGTTIAKKTLNGIEKYWCRWRITNAWSSVPDIEYIKMHTNSTEINKDGFLEYFGDSRPVGKLDWNVAITLPANASPDNQDVYISDKLGVGRVENRMKNGVVDRLGLNEFLPTDIDISFPIKIKFAVLGDNAGSGNVEFVARWNSSNNGSSVYRSTGNAPSTSTGEQSSSCIINISSRDTEYRGEIVVNCAAFNPNPSSREPDLIWLTIERDATGGNANDTYPGNVTIIQMGVFYVKWRDGGHIGSY